MISRNKTINQTRSLAFEDRRQLVLSVLKRSGGRMKVSEWRSAVSEEAPDIPIDILWIAITEMFETGAVVSNGGSTKEVILSERERRNSANGSKRV